jgi:hypothetical protein
MECNIIAHVLSKKFNLLMMTFVETCRGVDNKFIIGDILVMVL